MCGRAQPSPHALCYVGTADGTQAARPRPRRKPRASLLLRRVDARQPGPSYAPLRPHHTRRPRGARGASGARGALRPTRLVAGRQSSTGPPLQQTRTQGRTCRSPPTGFRRTKKRVGAAIVKGSGTAERTRTRQRMSAQALRAPTNFGHGRRSCGGTAGMSGVGERHCFGAESESAGWGPTLIAQRLVYHPVVRAGVAEKTGPGNSPSLDADHRPRHD